MEGWKQYKGTIWNVCSGICSVWKTNPLSELCSYSVCVDYFVKMGKIKIQNLKNSINFAKIVKKLKCPTLIKHFLECSSDKNLCDFYRIVANLIHNENFSQNSLIKRKIPQLRKIMSPYKKQWTDITKSPTKNPQRKKRFLIDGRNYCY